MHINLMLRVCLFAIAFSAVLSAQGGNAPGLQLDTAFNQREVSASAKPIEDGTLSLDVDGSLSGLLGAPFLIAADVQTYGARVVLEFPGEVGAMGLGPGLFILVDGIGGFLPGVDGSAHLQPVASEIDLPIGAGESAQLPAGTQVGIQVFVLDASKPNGIAMSNLVLHHSRLLTQRSAFTNLDYGRDTLQGYAIETADLDGNGADEMIVASPRAAPQGFVEAGEVRIHRGGNLQSYDLLTAPSPSTSGWFGGALAIGELNGDGRPDLVVGARYEAENGLPGAGAVYLFDANGYGLIARLVSPTPQADAEFSKALTTLDWNGDGFCDVAVGEALADVAGQNSVGRVHVFLGPLFTNVITIENPTGQAGSRFGYALVGGDFDGDGADELVAAAPYYDQGAANDNSGALFVFPGLSVVPSQSDFHAEDDGAFYGAALAVADFDQDGNRDLVVSAEFADVQMVDDGLVQILYGPGLSDQVTVSCPVPQNTGGFGGDVSVGDANADGFPDLVVGEFYATVGGIARAGRGWIIYGPFFDSSEELLPDQGAAYAFAGRVVACGDVDGNGISNPILGAPFASPGGALNHYAGELTLFH